MWTKFKRWLIKRLGGYVAPNDKYQQYTQTIIQTHRPLEKLEAWFDMNTYKYMGYDYANNQPYAKTEVEQEIFRHLTMGDYIKWEYEDDGILRGTLMVVRPI